MEPAECGAPARAPLAQPRASMLSRAVSAGSALAVTIGGALGDLLLAPRLSAPFALFTRSVPRASAAEPSSRDGERAP